jgi:hypothetical protein
MKWMLSFPLESGTWSDLHIHTIIMWTLFLLFSDHAYRVVQTMRKWLQLSYDDFKNDELLKKLDLFIGTIQK